MISRLLVALFRLVVFMAFVSAASPAWAQSPEVGVRINRALVETIKGTQEIQLPYKLKADEFEPAGSIIRFRLIHRIDRLPQAPLGLYVGKMSLSGRLKINGHLIGACERGDLKDVRCLHRPYIFEIPPVVWQAGDNVLDFEIFANARQMNGLSAPVIGDLNQLDRQIYMPDYLLRVETIHFLTWASLTLGILALAVGLLLRSESAFVWFGLTSVTNALSNLNVLVSQPMVSTEFFSWFVFSARMVSAPFMLLTFAAFFGPTATWLRRSVFAYVILAPLVVAISGNNRWVAVGLYIPILVLALGFAFFILRGAIRAREPFKWIIAVSYLMLLGFGAVDFARLGGATDFEGVYLIAYSHSGLLVIFGIALVTLLARALLTARSFNTRLEKEVAQRTADLESAYRALTDARIERSRIEERERLLQDMHDGFGSQLASARLMAEQGRIGPAQLSQLLQECIADLYLVADTLSGSDDSLVNAIVDMRARTERRLAGREPALHWFIELDQAPRLPQRVILQLLRIVQEALNNAFKHAKAKNIRIEARWRSDERALVIGVSDDGVGFVEPMRRGRGLNNMHRRAREIGGDLSIDVLAAGTQVSVRLVDGAWSAMYPDPQSVQDGSMGDRSGANPV